MPYAADRHHMFILEGVRDLQQQFSERGVNYAFHLETRLQPGGHLRGLCDRATVTVTDDLPVEPFRGWNEQLDSDSVIPVVCVDTACVVPPQLVGKAYDRAFQYRKATQDLYEERLCSMRFGTPRLPSPKTCLSTRHIFGDTPYLKNPSTPVSFRPR